MNLFSFFDTKTKATQEPSELGIEIPVKVKELVERFDPMIRIEIINISTIHAQAPISKHPYIELSKRLFETRTNSLEQFTDEDIKVLVAHELGHIIPKSYFNFLFFFILSLVAALILWSCFILSLYPLPGIVLLILFLGYISRKEEYKADKFAITEAGISVEAFVQCFSKADAIRKQEIALETGLKHLMKSVFRLMIKTHPSIAQRISRVRAL